MSQLVALNTERQLTPADVRSHVNLIQEVMKGVMKKDTHFGIIPGCDKPSLYKAGSEVLFTTFRIAVEPEVDDLSTGDAIRYRVRAVGRHQTSGIVVGIGIGECSTDEEKYRWRRAASDKEFDATPENRRRIKYGSYWDKGSRKRVETETKQVRTEPADLANTVLKMAKKRAQIDLCLTSLSASDIFTQDVEDMPDELRGAATGGDEGVASEPITEPQSRSGQAASTEGHEPGGAGDDGENLITEKQVKLLYAKLKNANVELSEFCKAFAVEKLNALPFKKMNDALAWISERA